jgi:Prokaryotic dksA/traR C4-type zinc finger
MPFPAVKSPPATVPPRPSPARCLEWLAQRRRALCHDWRLADCPQRDDDLLPARQWVEHGLVEVEHALERVRRGCYGRCQRCGGCIDFERLLALPTAERCWPCQQSAEAEEAPRPH